MDTHRATRRLSTTPRDTHYSSLWRWHRSALCRSWHCRNLHPHQPPSAKCPERGSCSAQPDLCQPAAQTRSLNPTAEPATTSEETMDTHRATRRQSTWSTGGIPGYGSGSSLEHPSTGSSSTGTKHSIFASSYKCSAHERTPRTPTQSRDGTYEPE